MAVHVRLGLVPSYRFAWTPWTARMREENLVVLSRLPSVEVVVPQESSDDKIIDAVHGLTPHGAVHTLDEAEAIAAFFAHEQVDGLVICPLDFGDERSACKIAEKLRVPVLHLRDEGAARARRRRAVAGLRLLLRHSFHCLRASSPRPAVPFRGHLLP